MAAHSNPWDEAKIKDVLLKPDSRNLANYHLLLATLAMLARSFNNLSPKFMPEVEHNRIQKLILPSAKLPITTVVAYVGINLEEGRQAFCERVLKEVVSQGVALKGPLLQKVRDAAEAPEVPPPAEAPPATGPEVPPPAVAPPAPDVAAAPVATGDAVVGATDVAADGATGAAEGAADGATGAAEVAASAPAEAAEVASS